MRWAALAPVLYVPSALAVNPRLLVRDDICLHQEDFRDKVIQGDAAKAKDFWNGMKATEALADYLTKNGVDNWANNFLGAPYDCGNFPASNNCRSPDKDSCSRYEPPVKYYIQTAMSNFYNALYRWHEALQDTVLQEVTSGIQEITDDWGPPEPPKVDIVELILGAVTTVTGFLDEAIAGPIEKAMSIFEEVQKINEAAAADDPDKLDKDLHKSLGETFDAFKKQLETTVKHVFEGKFQTENRCSPLAVPPMAILETLCLDPGPPITDIFADGVWLDSTIVNKAVDAWLSSMTGLIHEGLIVAAIKESKAGKDEPYFQTVLKISPGYSNTYGSFGEEDCKKIPLTVWDDNACKGFATFKGHDNFSGVTNYDWFNEDEVAKARKSFRDADQALRNAVDCAKGGGGDPSYPPPDFNSLNSGYTHCFFNINVWEEKVN